MSRDLRHAWRTLRTQPLTSLLIVMTLAVGIGATSALFTYLAEEHWPRVRSPDGEQLFVLRTDDGHSSYPDALVYAAALDDAAEVAPWAVTGVILTPPEGVGGRRSLFGLGSAVSPPHFRFFGVHGGAGGRDFALGRDFVREEFSVAGPRVAVLDHSYWRRHLAADPDILGKSLRLNGVPFTVVGVAPRGFENAGWPHQVYVPMARLDDISHRPRLENRGARNFRSLVRLPPEVAIPEARRNAGARLAVLARRLDAEEPWAQPRRLALRPLQGEFRELDDADLMLVAAVAMLLLLATANVANLLLAKAAGRRREIAIQAALGAGSWRIARRLLVESLVLATAGGVLGLGVNRALTALMQPFYATMPIGFANLMEGGEWRQIDGPALLFTFGVALFTGVLFGLAPVFQALGTDLVSALRGSGLDRRAGRRWGARQILIVTQIALSTVLILSTALLVRSLGHLQDVELGFDTENQILLAVAASPPISSAAATRQAQRQIYELGRAHLAAVPGVEAATIAAGAPGGFSDAIEMELSDRPDERFAVDRVPIGRSFFATYGIGPIRGRTFDDGDRAGAVGAVIVDDVFAERFFAGREVLGQEVHFPGLGSDAADDRFVVVGVAPAVSATWKPGPPKPRVYLPLSQYIFGKQLLAAVKLSGPPAAVLPALREAVSHAHPGLALLDEGTYHRLLAAELRTERLWAMLLSAFGASGLVMACLGIYSVMSCTVSYRRRELGIRVAVGATERDLSSLVLGEASRLAAWGIAAGVVAAFAVGHGMRGLLHGVGPHDPATFLGLPIVLGGVVLAAAWPPARRAGRVDPVSVLHEK